MRPDPLQRFPLPGWHGTAYLKAIVTNPRIEVGDISSTTTARAEHFEAAACVYHFDFVGDG